MIIGVLDRTHSALQLQEELRKRLARVSGVAPEQAKITAGRQVAMAWIPSGIRTLDEPDQPFISEDGAVQLLFEGKIYNRQELSAGLPPGHQMATRHSGEVLVHRYEESPERFLDEVNGKFAFALWDERRQQLLLGTDHFGIEPLYYGEQGQRVVFSTSLKALVCSGFVANELSVSRTLTYLLYCYNPGEATLIQGVQRVPPAHVVQVTENISPRRYWRLSFTPNQTRSEAECRRELPRLIEDAIRIRLEPDEPPGVFLSGGVDSSAIAMFLSRLLPEPVRAFSFFCEGRSYNESPYAALVAKQAGARHVAVPYRPETVRQITKAVEAMDEPFCDVGIEMATYLLGRTAQGHVTYVMSGEGGDELFAGHPAYTADRVAAIMDRLPPWLLRPVMRGLQALPDSDQKKNLAVQLKRFAYSVSFPRELLSHRWRVYYTPRELAGLWAGGRVGGWESSDWFEDVTRYAREADGPDALSRSLYTDCFTLVGFYLRRLRLLRAFGIESRLPLLDYRLVEYAATIPAHLKLRGFSDTKYIYRKALEGIVPHQILHGRPKLGHSVPLKNWLRQDAGLKRWVREILLEGSLCRRGGFRAAAIERLLDEHERMRHNHSHRIWALVVLALWLDQNARWGNVPSTVTARLVATPYARRRLGNNGQTSDRVNDGRTATTTT